MLWICQGCTCAYSVGAPRCPQCGSTDYREEGEEMPKITVHGGPSNAAAEPIEVTGEVVDGPAVPFKPLPDADENGTTTEQVSEPDYNALKVGPLREELSRRGLDTDGVKTELVARLEADDAAPEGGDG